jgi:hypothetical protein
MIANFMCETCKKAEVCKIRDIILKFHVDAKKPLFCDIEMKNCDNYEYDKENKHEGIEQE